MWVLAWVQTEPDWAPWGSRTSFRGVLVVCLLVPCAVISVGPWEYRVSAEGTVLAVLCGLSSPK